MSDRVALRMFRIAVGGSGGGPIVPGTVETYRPVPAREACVRERERADAIDAERLERRVAGGAYSLAGRGGHGSMMSTSWTDVVPKPGVSSVRWNQLTLVREGHVRLPVLDCSLVLGGRR